MILYPIIIYCTMYPVCCLVYFFKYHDLTINTVGHLELTIPAHPFNTTSPLIPSILPLSSSLQYSPPAHPFNTTFLLTPSILPPYSSLQYSLPTHPPILPLYSSLLLSLPTHLKYSRTTHPFNTPFLISPSLLPLYSSLHYSLPAHTFNSRNLFFVPDIRVPFISSLNF